MSRKTLLQSTSIKDVAYLKQAGWTIADEMWLDPRKDAAFHKRTGGYCDPAHAVRRQREYDRFDKGLPIYAVCRARDTYGYLLRKCTGADRHWTTVTRYHDEDYLLQSIAEIEERALGMKDDAKVLAAWEQRMTKVSDDHQYPYLLLLEEKHGTFRYHVPTREAFHKACLAVVKRRNEQECWYEYEDAVQVTEGEKPPLSKTQIAQMADGRTKRAAEQEWEEYEARLKRLEGETEERELLAKALKGDGEAAAEFLRARADGEYEGFELVELDNVEDES